MEKQLGLSALSQVGSILETVMQPTPMPRLQNEQISKACSYYRSMLNSSEAQCSQDTRQIISRQLAELILRNISKSSWIQLDSSIIALSGNLKQHRVNGSSLFNPKSREEEIILLLLISEMIASRNVVLDRRSEFNESRKQSLQTIIKIYDLLTIALIPCKYYIIDLFEKAMKFNFEVKHIWFQFGLSVMEAKKEPLRAVLIFKEVARIDLKDPLPSLLASKIFLLELDDAAKSLELAMEALKRNVNNQLLSKIYLLIGIANALLYEEEIESVKKLKKDHLNESIKYFKLLANLNPEDHLPYYHLALHMAHQRSISDAILNAQVALILNPYHLPTIELLILCLSSLKKYQDALNLCEAALEEYQDHLLLLYIKAHLEQVVTENGYELALLTAKHMIRCLKLATAEEKDNLHHSNHLTLTGTNYDNLSLKVEQTLSEAASLDSCPALADETFKDNPTEAKQLWNFQIHIWIMIAELYIKLGLYLEAESCIAEVTNVVFGPLSHQLMYIKGLLCKAKNQLIEAKTFFQNAISINPKHAKALQHLGHTYYLLGNQLSAEKYLKDSLNIDATLHDTWFYFGGVLDELQEYERAADCTLTSIQLESTAPILPFNLIPRAVLE